MAAFCRIQDVVPPDLTSARGLSFQGESVWRLSLLQSLAYRHQKPACLT
jgi:hypothetical protein